MVLVDSSVRIDYFRDISTPACDKLDALLGVEPLGVGNLILAEALQGFTASKDFEQASKLMTSFQVIDLVGQAIAIQAVRHFRAVRQRGETVRKTIDTLIAPRCSMAASRCCTVIGISIHSWPILDCGPRYGKAETTTAPSITRVERKPRWKR